MFHSVQTELWYTEITNLPLNRRAWVLQERLLPRRNLHFARREVFGECPERARCESVSDLLFPDLDSLGGDDESSLKSSLKRPHSQLSKSQRDFAKEQIADRPLHNLAIYLKWKNIVTEYAKANLSFPSDKLVALGGVARQIKTVLDDTYVAGLWLRCLSGEILWSTGTTMIPSMDRPKLGPYSETPGNYRAPSFFLGLFRLPGLS